MPNIETSDLTNWRSLNDKNFILDNEALKSLLGKTIAEIEVSEEKEQIALVLDDGRRGVFFHEQDCCEWVEVDEISGDLKDLIGAPIIVAEERSNEGNTQYGTETWTFYTFRTIKGTVDIKWHGESNGYYSESVNFRLQKEVNHA